MVFESTKTHWARRNGFESVRRPPSRLKAISRSTSIFSSNSRNILVMDRPFGRCCTSLMRSCECIVNLGEGVGLMPERGTFHFYPPRFDPTLISCFRLRSTTGLEAKRALPAAHSSTNSFRKIDRLQRFLHRFHKPSPPTRIPFTLSASVVIGATQLPPFRRFGCPWIPTARTAISSAHIWTVAATHYLKQAPARIPAETQELATRSTEPHPLNLF